MALVVCGGSAAAADGESQLSAPAVRTLLTASGVGPDRIAGYASALDKLGDEVRAEHVPAGSTRQRARAVHAFLHRRVLCGRYRASASHLGDALDGGAFNCAAASALYQLLARRCGLPCEVLSVRGHVWCRVTGAGETIDVETTCADWFVLAAKYAGLPDGRVSRSMAAHRRRVAAGRVLSDRQLLAIFYYNRGVTHVGQRDFTAALWANLRALWFDPACQPAYENLLFCLDRAAAGGSAGNAAG